MHYLLHRPPGFSPLPPSSLRSLAPSSLTVSTITILRLWVYLRPRACVSPMNHNSIDGPDTYGAVQHGFTIW